ncbi:MAG: hypothetical protein KAX39_07370 [candidate division Zixibacteria bacterium]|nr:hypothetical protein [candidate division Zixibacteria bacterium]
MEKKRRLWSLKNSSITYTKISKEKIRQHPREKMRMHSYEYSKNASHIFQKLLTFAQGGCSSPAVDFPLVKNTNGKQSQGFMPWLASCESLPTRKGAKKARSLRYPLFVGTGLKINFIFWLSPEGLFPG